MGVRMPCFGDWDRGVGASRAAYRSLGDLDLQPKSGLLAATDTLLVSRPGLEIMSLTKRRVVYTATARVLRSW